MKRTGEEIALLYNTETYIKMLLIRNVIHIHLCYNIVVYLHFDRHIILKSNH